MAKEEFREWYRKWAEKTGINPNPDDPKHFYDYRASFRAGVEPVKNEQGIWKWPSKFKIIGHPTYHKNNMATYEELLSKMKKTTAPLEPKREEGLLGIAKGVGRFAADITGVTTAFEFGRVPTRVAETVLSTSIQKELAEATGGLADLTTQMIGRIRTMSEGEPKERMRNIVRENLKEMNLSREASKALEKEMITPKEVAGKTLSAMATAIAAQKVSKVDLKRIKTAPRAFVKGFAKAAPKGALTGALFGAGRALEQEKEIEGVITEAIKGGVLGGMMSGLFGGYFARKQFQAPIKAQKLREQAIKSYQAGLRTTKEKYKEKAQKVIPKLLDKGWWGSRQQLLKKAQQGMALNQAEYKALGELQGAVEVSGLENMIKSEMAKYELPSGRVISVNRGKHTALQNLLDDIIALKQSNEASQVVNQQALRELAGQYGESLYETRKALKTIEDSKTLSQVKKVDSSIRTLLNTKNPDYAAINKVYHTNTELYDILQETAKREGGQKWVSLTKLISFGTGIVFGGQRGGVQGAIIGGIALPTLASIFESTWFRTLTAMQKWKLADKLMKLPQQDLPNILTSIVNMSPKTILEFINE